MRIIISPAKRMGADADSFSPEGLPAFLPRTRLLLEALRAMSPETLQKLWRCNDQLARLNVDRLAHMELERGLAPAVMAYEGIQYQYMAPGVMETEQLDWLREHLRILSGFYGLLRPFDGVTPYRLELQAKLAVDGARDLYAFWGDSLARALAAETDCVVDLASKEYSKAVEPWLPEGCRFITCSFVEDKDGKLVEKGTACKMARGQLVRWAAEHGAETAEALRDFSDLGYAFSPERSEETRYVFIKGGR